jgi:EAL domain-containing protein (putative c-di-GMP-specific phosphodiesterase class I)/FixJ family two-component response regulator
MQSDLRVLVLEDHGFQRRMALRLLHEIGIAEPNLLDAADASSALALLAAQSAPPDIVLVDLDMPGMDGIEFLGHVAQRRLARNVALVSALDPALLDAVQAMAASYGLNIAGVVEKPLSTDKLMRIVHAPRLDWGEPDAVPAEAIDEDALRRALADGGVRPWFQLQVDMTNGKPRAVEALARWHDGDRVVPPSCFIEPLERMGLAQALTESMLEQACTWKREWERAHGLRLCVAINVSPLGLGDPAVADRLEAIVARHGLQANDVVLEVTESSVLADLACGLQVLARLRLKGFGLSIDDFGVGYSSLSQLSQLPFTELKIDREFVGGVVDQPRRGAVVEASLELARKLRITAVAEGIETAAQWQRMAELGCGLAQGFLIARPVPGADLADAVARWRRPD